jgi:pimeloyl-ACP methyl ester carboxylesterase
LSRRRKLAVAAVALPLLALGAVLATPSSALPPATGAWMTAAGLREHFVAVDGVRVRYVRQGEGRGPAVVLLHGFVSSIYSWKEVLPALSSEHDVLAVDLPPFGASDIPATFDPSLYERIVPAILDHAGVARAAVVGNSLGGAVAIVTAVRHPSRVDRLVLVDSAGFNFAPERRPWLLRVMGSPLLGPVIGTLPVRRELVTLGLRQVLHDDRYATEERVDEYLAPLLRPGAMAAAHGLLGGRQSMGFPEVVREVKVPTLVIWGAEDRWIPASDAKLFQQRIPAPGTRVAVLPGCGHIPQEECADAVLAPLLSFLRQTP